MLFRAFLFFLVMSPGVAVAQTLPLRNFFPPAEVVEAAGEGLQLYPLGWSSEGRWGAVIKRAPDGGSGEGSLRIVVIDAVTDERLFESRDYSWSDADFANEFGAILAAQIQSAIEAFDLESSRNVDVRDPKFITGGIKYIFSMEPAIPVDSAYSLIISSSRGDSKMVYRSSADAPRRVSLLGVLMSPFEERALAVLREKPRSEKTPRYRFVGAHLTLGFTLDQTGAAQVSGTISGRLLTAVFNGQEYLVRSRLAAGADPNIRDNRGYPAILVAARLGHWPMVIDLLAAGASPSFRDDNGRNVLHYAAIAGHAEAVKALLATGIDKTIRDKKGRTAGDISADMAIRALLQ